MRGVGRGAAASQGAPPAASRTLHAVLLFACWATPMLRHGVHAQSLRVGLPAAETYAMGMKLIR
jgi:hypothetical protein